MKVYEYEAIAFKQTQSSDLTVSFCASSLDINDWAGVPRKKYFDNVETSGFQRNIAPKRLDSLVNFYDDERNIIQNPLLCASRNSSRENESGVFFTADKEDSGSSLKGRVKIVVDDYSEKSLSELLELFLTYLETREPNLIGSEVDQNTLYEIKKAYYGDEFEGEYQKDIDFEVLEKVSIDASHIHDLWHETKSRILLLAEEDEGLDDILGFDRESIISYLLPATIVDGQHRLLGAIAHFDHIKESAEIRESIQKYVVDGLSPEDVELRLREKYARMLPVSLSLCDDPAEHVFQFVVVNQKATPINNALLGTIVSTTLSMEELQRVATRLRDADIPLEDSRAVSYVTRNADSPFYNLVQTGISGEGSAKLPWTVMKSLVAIFKELKGAKYFSDSVKNDFADIWKRKALQRCDLVEGETMEEKFNSWSSDDGVWKIFFNTFWEKVRDKFGSVDDEERSNYWGKTSSNLFNKVSLTILTADFFEYISTARGIAFNTQKDIEDAVDDWMAGLDASYFDRNWGLENVKKDSPGVRKQWSSIWMNYRRDPVKMPSVSLYRISMK